MAISVSTIADKVYGLLKGYGFNIDTFDKIGEVVANPSEAVRFFVEDPNLLVTINMNENEIRLSVSENTEQTDRLRGQLNNLSRSYLMTTDFRVFGKTLKPSSESVNIKKEKDMTESGVMEGFGSMSGSMKTSYQPLDNVKIIVKHAKAVNEEVRGSRSRNISKIFIQRGEERFAFPSKNLSGARAMARHIHNGGEMHDSIGESIVSMCNDLSKLKEFVRYVTQKGLINEDNTDYVNIAKSHIQTIKETFKKLSGVKSYTYAVEGLQDYNSVEVAEDINLEDLFTERHIDDKVLNVHDTLQSLVNKQKAFETYIFNAIELESFENCKDVLSESGLEFENPKAQLGYRIGQLSSVVKDQTLSHYLSGIGSKLSNGGDLGPMEYRAVKASLLSANQPTVSVAENKEYFVESSRYEKFIDSFITFDK